MIKEIRNYLQSMTTERLLARDTSTTTSTSTNRDALGYPCKRKRIEERLTANTSKESPSTPTPFKRSRTSKAKETSPTSVVFPPSSACTETTAAEESMTNAMNDVSRLEFPCGYAKLVDGRWKVYHYPLSGDGPEWEIIRDDDNNTGKILYYNPKSQKTCWTRPKELQNDYDSGPTSKHDEQALCVAELENQPSFHDKDSTPIPRRLIEDTLRRAEFAVLLQNAIYRLRQHRDKVYQETGNKRRKRANNDPPTLFRSLLIHTRTKCAAMDLNRILFVIADDDEQILYMDEATEILTVLVAFTKCLEYTDDDGWTVDQSLPASNTEHVESLTNGWLPENKEMASSFVWACLKP